MLSEFELDELPANVFLGLQAELYSTIMARLGGLTEKFHASTAEEIEAAMSFIELAFPISERSGTRYISDSLNRMTVAVHNFLMELCSVEGGTLARLYTYPMAFKLLAVFFCTCRERVGEGLSLFLSSKSCSSLTFK